MVADVVADVVERRPVAVSRSMATVVADVVGPITSCSIRFS